MKIGRIVCTVFLLALCLIGWVVNITGASSDGQSMNQALAEAEEYTNKQLYQKAIQSYGKALSLSERADIYDALLAVYEQALAEGTVTRKEYQQALESACTAFPENTSYWETLLEQLYQSGSYQQAYKLVRQIKRNGVSSGALDALCIKVTYSYTTSRQTYTQFWQSARGYISAAKYTGWGVLAPDGEIAHDFEYRYISPYNSENTALFCLESGAERLVDENGVVQALITQELDCVRAYGDGLLPIYLDHSWRYLNCADGVCRDGSYEDASSYQNGYAAVKQNGKWALVDTAGQDSGMGSFDEIKLYSSGEYAMDGLMVASVGGYGLYQTDGSKSNGFTAENMDVYLGGYLAYQDSSGLWGYVDAKGNEVISPQFKEARSFSHGLAAVYDGSAWGFIDKNGTLVIDYTFLDTGYFTEKGVCLVSTVAGEYYALTLRFPEVMA